MCIRDSSKTLVKECDLSAEEIVKKIAEININIYSIFFSYLIELGFLETVNQLSLIHISMLLIVSTGITFPTKECTFS